MLCQSMFIIAMRISIFQSLLIENEAYNIFLAFFYLCSWKFLSFSHDLTLSIVGSTFQLSGRHDLIGSSRSVVIFAASQAVRLPAVKLTSFLNFTTRHPVSRVVNNKWRPDSVHVYWTCLEVVKSLIISLSDIFCRWQRLCWLSTFVEVCRGSDIFCQLHSSVHFLADIHLAPLWVSRVTFKISPFC